MDAIALNIVQFDISLAWTHGRPQHRPLMVATIEVTPEVQALATDLLPAARDASIRARDAERGTLATVGGEKAWRRAGGADLALSADAAARKVEALALLASGRHTSGSTGTIEAVYARRILDLAA